MRKIKRLIKESDNLGYAIDLNFDEKGSYHKTYVGGIFSIIIMITMSIYLIYGCLKIF